MEFTSRGVISELGKQKGGGGRGKTLFIFVGGYKIAVMETFGAYLK